MTTPEDEIILIDGWEHVHCPVCGELVGVYDICDKCGWQNTGETNIDGGPNHITLAEAQKQYKETGKIIRPNQKVLK